MKKPYAVMLQTDDDDQYITESILAETGMGVEVRFLNDVNELHPIVIDDGGPTVIMVNDSSRNTAHEQLRQLKVNKAFNHIPVVILGEIVTDEYISQYYREGANSYIIKPSTISDTRKKIEAFFQYWFDVVEV